jgi:SpoIID/LytB domain protein
VSRAAAALLVSTLGAAAIVAAAPFSASERAGTSRVGYSSAVVSFSPATAGSSDLGQAGDITGPGRFVTPIFRHPAGVAALLPPVVIRGDHSTSRSPGLQSRAAAQTAPPRPVVRVSIGGRVARLDLEDYVAQVVAGESEPGAPAAAQEALAITVRTFALANLNRHRREGFDLCDTTHCQVPRPATSASRRAAQATSGRVLVHDGRPAAVFYSALCGGRSELASAVWPGAVDYIREPLQDEACGGEPGWSVEIRASEIERALRRAGYRGRLRDLRVIARSASGRVARILVGRVAGLTRLRSTAFDVRSTRGGYLFTGRGFGHGVGLCVIGARHRAQRGTTASEILAFYFPTLQIASIDTARPAPAAGAPRGAAGSGSASTSAREAASSAGVDVTLPEENAGDSAELAALVRAARDEISSRAGVAPPRTIRVVVHPTIEAFSRATGQPWWAAGASDGAVVELPPVALLRSQGRLDSAVRQQVARVLLDATLARRPQWVRDGAALFFSSDNPASAPAERVECPADEELLRPLSAGAHRMALARAEACFRRAIAQGKRWNEVR